MIALVAYYSNRSKCRPVKRTMSTKPKRYWSRNLQHSTLYSTIVYRMSWEPWKTMWWQYYFKKRCHLHHPTPNLHISHGSHPHSPPLSVTDVKSDLVLTSLFAMGVLSSPGRCCSKARTTQLAVMVARIMYSNGVKATKLRKGTFNHDTRTELAYEMKHKWCSVTTGDIKSHYVHMAV